VNYIFKNFFLEVDIIFSWKFNNVEDPPYVTMMIKINTPYFFGFGFGTGMTAA
jgi:hypothetical protein